MKRKLFLLITSTLTGLAWGMSIATGANNLIVALSGFAFSLPFGFVLKNFAEEIANS